MEAFQLSVGRAGFMMSVFAMTGVILALPAGLISQRLGHKLTGLLAVGSVAVGAAIGAVSTSTGMMLSSRVVEGVGTSLFAVVAPALIAAWFASSQRGAPMGLWATWVPVGSTVMLAVAPALAQQRGWRGVWWFGCLYAVAVGLLFHFLLRPAPSSSIVVEPTRHLRRAEGALPGDHLKSVLRNRDLWLNSFVFCCFNIAFVGFVTWAPTFLNTVRGLSLVQASTLISIVPMLNIVSCPLSGWLSDRIGSRKAICVVPMLLMAGLWPLASVLSGGGFLALIIALGFVSGFVPTGLFAAGPEIVGDERLSGMAVAILLVGMNAGMLLGPLALGWLVESGGGWSAAFGALVPVCVVGAVAGWVARVK